MAKCISVVRIFNFYREGFRNMKLGKVLWLVILIKLFIILFVLKLIFFPNFLKQFGSDANKQEHVSNELVERAITP